MDTELQAAAKLFAAAGGRARARKLTKRRRKEIAASGGQAVQQRITPAERSRRAKLAWKKRKTSVAKP